MRRILLIVAIVATTIVLVVWSAATALWISVSGTIFRGERVTLGIVLQIGVAALSCVGLVFLIRSMVRASKKA